MSNGQVAMMGVGMSYQSLIQKAGVDAVSVSDTFYLERLHPMLAVWKKALYSVL